MASLHIGILRRVKRTAAALLGRMAVRREAARAFRYDKSQFMANAGALHLDRKAAARAEIVMGYHVLEKGLTMPNRRMGFGKGALIFSDGEAIIVPVRVRKPLKDSLSQYLSA